MPTIVYVVSCWTKLCALSSHQVQLWPYAKGGAEVVDLSPNSSSRRAHFHFAELLPPPPYFLTHKCERIGLLS